MKNKKVANVNLVLKKATEVISKKNTDGSIAVMRLDNDQYFYSLNGIAAEIWSLIDNEPSLEKIKERLIKKHAPPLKKFNADVTNLIREFRKEHLLT